jgi:hypothetical protein
VSKWILCIWHADQPETKGLTGTFVSNQDATDWFQDNKLGDLGFVYATSEINSPVETLTSILEAAKERGLLTKNTEDEDVGKS